MGMEMPAAAPSLLPETGAVVAAEVADVDVEEEVEVEVLEWLVVAAEGAWVVAAPPVAVVAALAWVEVVLEPIKPDPAPPELEPPDPEPDPALPSGQEVVGSEGL